MLRGELIIYLFPPVLIVFYYLLFHFLTSISGMKDGYVLGMVFYWILGCLVPSFLWISRTNRKLLLRVQKINWWQIVLLVIPVILSFLLGTFKLGRGETSLLVVFLSLPYAFVNASCEEFLWRGIFFSHHPTNYFHAVMVPSIWFGIWYYVPLSIYPSASGNLYVVLSAVAMGFCWATVTYFTRSIFWSIVSHFLVNFSALGIIFYFG